MVREGHTNPSYLATSMGLSEFKYGNPSLRPVDLEVQKPNSTTVVLTSFIIAISGKYQYVESTGV